MRDGCLELEQVSACLSLVLRYHSNKFNFSSWSLAMLILKIVVESLNCGRFYWTNNWENPWGVRRVQEYETQRVRGTKPGYAGHRNGSPVGNLLKHLAETQVHRFTDQCPVLAILDRISRWLA